MSGDFTPEQKRYLEGFTTGLQVARSARTGGGASAAGEPSGPDADHLRAQDRTVKAGTQVFVTTSNGVKSAAREEGYLGVLEKAGVTVLEGVCFYILQNIANIRARNGWTNLVTNSAKLTNLIRGHKFLTEDGI